MNDNDLRALAAKLLKHYVADQNPVAEALVAQIPLNRLPAKVIPLITAEQRTLLDMLGGQWADIHEGKNVALIAQGCGGGDGGGDGGGGGGGGGGGSDGGGSGGGGEGGGSGGDAGSGAGADGAGQGDDSSSSSDSAQGQSDAQDTSNSPDSTQESQNPDAPSTNAQNASAQFSSFADMMAALNQNAPDVSISEAPNALTTDAPNLATMTDQELSDYVNSINAAPDPGVSAASLSSLAAQNAQENAALDAVSNGLNANATSQGTLGAIGSALSDAFSMSQANAAPAGPATSGVADIMDAANAAAQQGQLNSFLADNNTAAQVLSNYPGEFANMQTMNNSMLEAQGQQAVFGSQTGQTVVGSPTGGATLGDWHGAAPSTATATNPYGSLAMTPEQAQQAELAGQIGMIGAQQTSAAPTSSTNLNLAIGDPGAQLGSFTGPGAFSTAGPTSTGNSYQGTTAVGPSTGSQTAAAAPSVADTSTSSLTVHGSPSTSYTGIAPVDNAINNAVNNPAQTAINLGVGLIPGLGIANTISGLVGGPTVGGAVTGAFNTGATGTTGAPATGTSTSGGGDDTTIRPLLLSSAAPTQLDTSIASPSTTSTTAPSSSTDATTGALRQYLGLTGDPTKYGFGAEQLFYGPAAAKGGYFDAEQYFADGGMVQPLSAPTTPLVSTQPTMAFTDGAGPVGSIAQPPGLSPDQSVGFDATTASPMAPSIAASVPSVQPGLATLAMPNTNATPVPSQIAQNPNVGYALGNSPLSNLTRS